MLNYDGMRKAIKEHDWTRVEHLADAGLRHRADQTPDDYLRHSLSVARYFTYATPEDSSWGEFEKLFAIIIEARRAWFHFIDSRGEKER